MTNPSSPQKLGRYEVLEEIGKGAMGVVYLARDPLIGRQVALKTFRVGFSAKDQELQQFRSRFVREAQSAGILSHPNIVTIHDVVDEGGADGVCFIAMEYVKGTNLKLMLQRPEPFPTEFLVDIVAQIAEGLDYAHSRGVVHRDIKPANILITQDNKVKITDFGIARLDTSNLTMEGQLLGTPNYMAPEQIQGKEVDHRADIFSLGVVLYEMITRRKPFQGENLTAVTHKIVHEAFTPPEEIVRDLAPGLSAVLNRCLEKDPNRRYPRAAEIAAELRRSIANTSDEDDTSATQEVVEDTVDRVAGAKDEEVSRPAARVVEPKVLPAPPPLVTPALPPASLSGPTQVGEALGKIRKQRLIQVLIASLAGLAVVGLIALWAIDGDGPARQATVPTPAETQHAAAVRALAEARNLLDQGSLQGALQAIARAEQAEPANPEAKAMREEVDRISRDVAAAAEREQKVSEGLVEARDAYAKRRYEAAMVAANEVLGYLPDHPEATKLLRDSEAALERQKERLKAQKAATPAASGAPTPASAQPVATPKVQPAAPAAVARDAELSIDFFSEFSEGVLTIYDGERQILREPFKFVRKTGFLRSEKLSGTLEASRTLTAGSHTLRVYVAPKGKPTRAVVVEGDLAGGSKIELEIRVDSEGRTTAELN